MLKPIMSDTTVRDLEWKWWKEELAKRRMLEKAQQEADARKIQKRKKLF